MFRKFINLLTQTDRGNNASSQTVVDRKTAIEEYLGLAFIFVQLILIILVMRELDVTSSGFRRIIGIAAVGFIIHHLLPSKLRLAFFVLLSTGSILLVLGTPNTWDKIWDPAAGFQRIGIILGVGAALIGICHLPFSFWKRVGLLVLAGIVMGLFRADILHSGSLEIVWIVLPAFFMFRIIIYLYDISTSRKRPSLKYTLAYFFLMPNVCFTLFPVIDFKTFSSSHYNEAAIKIYHRGVRWMMRGLIQLVLYRFIQQLFYITAEQVASGSDLIQFFLTNSFLYLKVSGQFHIIVGLLLLFGFNLPETNHFYFLASSFTDYWRRVNIYWKDFMLKVFYYPAFFRLKKVGTTKALIVATVWVFFVTWALHLYQTWWLKGVISITLNDALFWSILGLLVVVNSMLEMKKTRKRSLSAGKYTMTSAFLRMFQTAGTFACICVLWSLWSTPSISKWLSLWSYADMYTLAWGAGALSAIMISKFVLEIFPSMKLGSAIKSSKSNPLWRIAKKEIFQYVVPMLLIFAGSHAVAQSSTSHMWLQTIQDVVVTGDSRVSNNHEGYYENLAIGMNEGERQLWESLTRKQGAPYRQFYTGANPIRKVNDIRFREPIPNTDIMAFDTSFKTNQWGMRDKEYPLSKPKGTVRIALLGSSNVMGWGVNVEDTFQAKVENRLNKEFSDSYYPRINYEILNFAFNALSPLGQIELLNKRIREFNPDMVIYVAALLDFKWVVRDIIRAQHQKVLIADEFLIETLKKAKVTGRTPEYLAIERLKPYAPSIVSWCYKKIVESCRSMNAKPVCLFYLLPSDLTDNKNTGIEAGDLDYTEKLKSFAQEAGFTLFDFTDIFHNLNPKKLLTPGTMPHCNAQAHSLIADALYRELIENPKIDLANLHNHATFNLASDPVNQKKNR